ncbi:MAG: hypothetical protein FWB83_07425 [Treponema sp.]|nr:hypothetical protein [Treponema sp.]
MKKKVRKITLLFAGVITAIVLCFLFASCVSEDTAYRIGYDIGSSLW